MSTCEEVEQAATMQARAAAGSRAISRGMAEPLQTGLREGYLLAVLPGVSMSGANVQAPFRCRVPELRGRTEASEGGVA